MSQRWDEQRSSSPNTPSMAGPSRSSFDDRRVPSDGSDRNMNRLSVNVSNMNMMPRRPSDQALHSYTSSPMHKTNSNDNRFGGVNGRSTPPRPTHRTSSRQITSPKMSPSNLNSVHDGHSYTEAKRSDAGPGVDGRQASLSRPGSSHDIAQPNVQNAGAASLQHSSSTNQIIASSSSQQLKDRPSGGRDQPCDACKKPMTGQFVRALGVVYHLDCFRCRDCNKVVAAKFFPATDEMNSSPTGSAAGHDGSGKQSSSPTTGGSGKLFPLCETDYFRRLDLLCANCGGALRGSYITALGKKFHVEHFTCSICPTVFGPQDSYYEHDGRVFCHFHYSTRFAIRCTGCRTAILKQFVEINRNNQDEHWHPECYMIHKFWNIKLCPTGSTPRENVALEPTTNPEAPEPTNSGVAPVSNASAMDAPSIEALETEANETPTTLKDKQKQMEEQVYRIWTVLSAFEESSAACISDMLRQVSNGKYLGGVRMAERFILHVEVLFAAIDDLEEAFRREQAKGISHIREARMLCKKIVNFFSLLSHTQETGAQRMGITQELLSLVTGLAHYLKILIRIALTGALRLERDFENRNALTEFLNRLASIAQETDSPQTKATQALRASISSNTPNSNVGISGSENKENVNHGYKSLPRSTSTSLTEGGESATDLCVACGQTVEEECVRIGINLRWHTACLKCFNCQRLAQRDPSSSKPRTDEEQQQQSEEVAIPEPIPAQEFALEIKRRSQDPTIQHSTLYTLYCSPCKTTKCRGGFERVSRLEQYSYLLRVALNRLYALLKKRGVVPASPPSASLSIPQPLTTPPNESASITTAEGSEDGHLDGTDIKRKKSTNLDRKLSTKAKVPHISTVVGSPSGHLPAVQKPSSPLDANVTRKSPTNFYDSTAVDRSQSDGGRRTPVRSRDVSPNGRAQHLYPGGQQQQRQEQQYVGTKQGPIVPIRPAFARHNTDVRIQDQGPLRQPSGDDSGHLIADPDEQLTLADIPQLLQQEQAREQHRQLPTYDGRAIADLSALELFVIKHLAVLMLQQGPLKDVVPFDELIDFIDIRKNTFWGKLFKGGKDKKKVEKKGTFNVPLEVLVDRNGADCTLGATSTVLRVPSFIDDIISSMRQMDVSIEGIFRKNGNIRRLKDLSEALDRDSSSVNLSDDNPVQLAALLKKWLRELPDPLLTFKLHRLFVMTQNVEPESERLRCMHFLSVLMPKAHRDTMEVLFVFLRWVASFSHIDEETGSKMDLQNLAMVLGPNILYSKGTDPAKDELFLANRAILCLLEHQDAFWRVPVELEVALQDRELLNTTNEITSRDILRRCEKYAKRARSGTMYPNPSNSNGGGSQSGNGNGFNGRSATQFSPQANRGGAPLPGRGFQGGGEIPHSSSTIRSLADPSMFDSTNAGGRMSPVRRGSQQQSPVSNDYVRSPIEANSGSLPPWVNANDNGHPMQNTSSLPPRSQQQQPYRNTPGNGTPNRMGTPGNASNDHHHHQQQQQQQQGYHQQYYTAASDHHALSS
ncbi:hypothetical protein L7F22_019419 [Adiantum nelumboides]|nr:hypothetical protein [Adiantum nelumboides]